MYALRILFLSLCVFLVIVAVPFSDADIAKSLLISISNDIGQIAYLTAKLHKLRRIYFGGYFIRGHPMTMHTITYAINYWSQVSCFVTQFAHIWSWGINMETVLGNTEKSR